MDICIKLSQFAQKTDHDDVRHLYDAAFGKAVEQSEAKTVTPKSPEESTGDSAEMLFDTIMNELDPETLAKRIGIPVDTARATYVMDKVIVDSEREFNDIIARFFLHLARHTGAIVGNADVQVAGSDAVALLESAFSRDGGHKGALAEARDGTRGGMRFILDRMADQFKFSKMQERANWVLKNAMETSDWDAQVQFVKVLLDRLGPDLPPEIKDKSPEEFAGDWETLARVYVQSLDKVKRYLRRF